MGGTETPANGVASWWPWARRALLIVLLLGGAWTLLRDGVPRVCHGAVAGGAVVRVCEPISATDLPVLLFLLVVVLLLLPELGELELAGVLTLRRRLAEAKSEVDEVKGELAQIRTQVAAAAAASVQAGLNNQMTLVLGDRQERVAEANTELAGDDGRPLDADETNGAFAQFAFDAGLAGLALMLPAWAANALVLGYTLDDTGTLGLTYVTGNSADPALTSAIAQVAASTDHPSISEQDECWVLTAPALEDAGSLVGALALLVPDDDLTLAEERVARGELMGDLAGWAMTAARAYARLLVDVLGESPRHPAEDGPAVEEGRSLS